MLEKELKILLDKKVEKYNHSSFIKSDPISVPHQFSLKEDIEISAFLTATIAWGNRKSIIGSANELMKRMDYSPYDFIINHKENELKKLINFKYRTFNSDDLLAFVASLKKIYKNHGGLEAVFTQSFNIDQTIKTGISGFREIFFQSAHLNRTEKHVSNPINGSAAKRINMFLRWMVRDDDFGVDFGLWSKIPMSALKCPLDVHSSRVARNLGLLERTQNDWKAVELLTDRLKQFDPVDPVKYDFALFGMGVFEKNSTIISKQ